LNYHWRVCREHQEAMEAYKDAKTSKPKFHLAIIKNETKNLALMKISYFLCQNALSFQKFPEISNLIFNQVLPMFGMKQRILMSFIIIMKQNKWLYSLWNQSILFLNVQ